jgi:hypothetical protein
MIEAYPLAWPEGRVRTPLSHREPARFMTTFARARDDVGVAVYFSYRNQQRCFACDRWNRIQDNMQAISKTIEALRGIERWATGDNL